MYCASVTGEFGESDAGSAVPAEERGAEWRASPAFPVQGRGRARGDTDGMGPAFRGGGRVGDSVI